MTVSPKSQFSEGFSQAFENNSELSQEFIQLSFDKLLGTSEYIELQNSVRNQLIDQDWVDHVRYLAYLRLQNNPDLTVEDLAASILPQALRIFVLNFHF